MIPEFYEDKEIFVTGGSGVVGSALIEQLLRTCNVRKIYILLRSKKNKSTEERLRQVKEARVFEQLKLQKPNELEKLEAVAGDVMLPMLGIADQSVKLLENVSIFYHCAATVRFDEPLRVALKLNVGGTLEALKLAQTLKKLKIFMHVSTFFSNPYLTRVEEKFYEPPMDWKVCLKLLERNDIGEDELDIITRKLIVGFPNTYTFTKNLAESVVNDHKDKLPVCIYRPSIVVFALEEPEPGFCSSITGIMGLLAVISAGVLKTIFGDKNNRLDMSPQDVVVRNMQYYSFAAAQLYENTKPENIPVYMTSSCNHSDKTLNKYFGIFEDFGLYEKCALEKNLLLPSVIHTSNRFLYIFLVIMLQLLPALFVDTILLLSGRKAALLRTQRKIFHTLEVMKPFMFNNYDSNGITNWEKIIEDCKGTIFNIEHIVNNSNELYTHARFCHTNLLNIRSGFFKEDPKSLPWARKIYKM